MVGWVRFLLIMSFVVVWGYVVTAYTMICNENTLDHGYLKRLLHVQKLLKAIQDDDMETISYYVKEFKVDPTVVDATQKSPVSLALHLAKDDIFYYLLFNNFTINLSDISEIISRKNLSMLRQVLDNSGMDINALDALACNILMIFLENIRSDNDLDFIDYLLNKGISISHRSTEAMYSKKTGIFTVTRYHEVKRLKHLVEHGIGTCACDSADHDIENILKYARDLGNIQAIQYLEVVIKYFKTGYKTVFKEMLDGVIPNYMRLAVLKEDVSDMRRIFGENPVEYEPQLNQLKILAQRNKKDKSVFEIGRIKAIVENHHKAFYILQRRKWIDCSFCYI